MHADVVAFFPEVFRHEVSLVVVAWGLFTDESTAGVNKVDLVCFVNVCVIRIAQVTYAWIAQKQHDTVCGSLIGRTVAHD